MFVRAYLRASTDTQDATRAKSQLESFAAENNLTVAAWYVENESGAKLARPALLDLIADCSVGDVLLVEQVDRLSRLNEADWDTLKMSLDKKEIKVVSPDLPTSLQALQPVKDGDITASLVKALNTMMLDVLAAVARKDYLTRRERSAQGIAKAKAEGKFKGRPENITRNNTIRKLLQSGTSYTDIMRLLDCSRATIAKQAALLKQAPEDTRPVEALA